MESEAAPSDLLIVAGEASGDLHGARMLSELTRLAPQIRAFGMGGQELQDAGMEIIADSSEISVVGITEVARILPRARQIFRRLIDEVELRGTKEAILIDFPDFNLRLAKALNRRDIRVLYYISPQIWAWRRGRVRSIARLIDRMLVILPFEVDFYRNHAIEAIHVGHPLVDEIPELEQRWEAATDPVGSIDIALLPGSRRSEIAANLPVMLSAGELLSERHDCRFRLIQAGTVDDRALEGPLAGSTLDVEIVQKDRFKAVADCHLAICASGTATLEVGLLGTPMVVVYKVSFWSYLLGKALVRLPHIALVNLVLEERVVPELIQHEATPEGIAEAASAILSDRDRIQAMRDKLGSLRVRLGEKGASRRAAEEILLELQGERV